MYLILNFTIAQEQFDVPYSKIKFIYEYILNNFQVDCLKFKIIIILYISTYT